MNEQYQEQEEDIMANPPDKNRMTLIPTEREQTMSPATSKYQIHTMKQITSTVSHLLKKLDL